MNHVRKHTGEPIEALVAEHMYVGALTVRGTS